MQCKYAIMFIPTRAPHKPFRNRKKQKKTKQCYALVRNHTPLSDMRVPFEEYKWTMPFLVKTLKKKLVSKMWVWEDDFASKLFHFLAAQRYMLADARYPTHKMFVLQCVSFGLTLVVLSILYVSEKCVKRSLINLAYNTKIVKNI